MNFLHHPWGIAAALAYLLILIVLYAASRKHAWLKKLYGKGANIASFAIVLVFMIAFGIEPKLDINHRWYFIVALLFLTTSLGLATIENIHHFRNHRPGVVLAHLSVLLILVAGLFGSGDKRCVEVSCEEGVPTNLGVDEFDASSTKLPFEITLHDFTAVEKGDRPQYTSDVTITRMDGTTKTTSIRVNHPARTGSWRIYQYSYGAAESGRSVSVFSCVKDPWAPFITVCLWMLMASAILAAFQFGGKDRTEKEEDRP